jgi:hypothetical protein
MYLRLDDPLLTAEASDSIHGFLRTTRRLTLGNRDAVAGKQLLGLVLVQIHTGSLIADAYRRNSGYFGVNRDYRQNKS